MSDQLVPRPQFAKELGVSHRTICRYERAKRPGFDEPIMIGNRVYHRRSKVEAVKRLGNGLMAEEVVA